MNNSELNLTELRIFVGEDFQIRIFFILDYTQIWKCQQNKVSRCVLIMSLF